MENGRVKSDEDVEIMYLILALTNLLSIKFQQCFNRMY